MKVCRNKPQTGQAEQVCDFLSSELLEGLTVSNTLPTRQLVGKSVGRTDSNAFVAVATMSE